VFRRALRWLTAALILAVLAAYAAINLSPDDPAAWHLDPAAIALRGTPNEFLAAAPGMTAANPGMPVAVFPESPETLLARLDAALRAEPRVTMLAADPGSLMATYVQRSRVIGFPDYITVKAVAVEGGASLILYSRSRYGHGDFGVNRARVERWLAALE
jgi:hypothetical protein